MKQFLSLAVMILFVTTVFSQNVAINNTGANANASAILDVTAINRGILIPRMSTFQRTNIPTPAKGLMVFDNDNSSFWFYNGTLWLQISAASNGWNLSGNTGINPATQFVGTIDEQSLRFRVNNVWAGEVHPTNGNLFFGVGAGQTNTAGEANSAFGEHAMFANTEGTFIVASGYYSLAANTTGHSNTATGAYALTSNNIGVYNTGTGRNALFANTNGVYNTATGASALLSSNGSYNTATGAQSLYSNTGGSFNTASGYQTLYFNTGGSYNTASGSSALYHNTTGLFNTATGKESLFNNSDGSNNTATGNEALRINGSGNYNTANGNQALSTNSGGNNNTAVGHTSLAGNSSGNYNTAIGSNAASATQGSNNTAVGGFALASNSTGLNNTAIGYGADVSTTTINATALGAGAIVNASNKVRIGNSAVSVIEGQVAYSFPSDARFKYNIKQNVPGLEFITRLTPITYLFDEEKMDEYTRTGIINNNLIRAASYNNEKSVHTGFLAQDVEKAAEQLGFNFDGVHAPTNDKDHYTLAYSQFIMPLVKAVQELSAANDAKDKKITELEGRMKKVEDLLGALKQ